MGLEKKQQRKIFLKQYFLFLLPVAVLLFIVSVYLYSVESKEQVSDLLNEETNALKLKESFIEHELEVVEADIQVLSMFDELIEYLDHPSKKNLDSLKRVYLDFSKQKHLYDQIRLINLDGKEILRIEHKNNRARIIDDLHMQDKSGRYYFGETVRLGRGEIYISNLDLNIEEGKIEVPFVPTIRYGIPIFIKNVKKCILVINFNAVEFLENIGKTYLDVKSEQMLLNKDGYWLLSGNKDQEWGFMFDDKKDITFPNKYPEIWPAVSSQPSGQINGQEGIFLYRTIYYARYRGINITRNNEGEPDLSWKLIAYLSNAELNKFLRPLAKDRIIIGLLLLLGAMIAVSFIAYLRVKNIVAQQKIAEQVEYLTERDKTKSRFFAIFSHDLKNSIGAVYNYSSMLKEDYYDMDDDERIRYINAAEDIAGNTINLLLTMLEWARSFITFTKEKSSLVNLCDVVNRNITRMQTEAAAKQIKLSSDIACDFEIDSHESVIDILLRNFIFNAVKFTPQGGSIKIYIREDEDGKLFLVVEDTGVGMSDKQIQKVLYSDEKYTTPGTQKETGSGMGLKLCKELVEKYNGELKVESLPGKGSKFCFWLG